MPILIDTITNAIHIAIVANAIHIAMIANAIHIATITGNGNLKQMENFLSKLHRQAI